jgi:hypothetical protein
MNTEESFSDSAYADKIHMAEGELSAFIVVVTELFGPEQARLSTADWLDESEVVDSPLDLQVEIGGRSRWRLPRDWQIGWMPSCSFEISLSNRLIRRYCQYHRPIVCPLRMWCDALATSTSLAGERRNECTCE